MHHSKGCSCQGWSPTSAWAGAECLCRYCEGGTSPTSGVVLPVDTSAWLTSNHRQLLPLSCHLASKPVSFQGAHNRSLAIFSHKDDGLPRGRNWKGKLNYHKDSSREVVRRKWTSVAARVIIELSSMAREQRMAYIQNEASGLGSSQGWSWPVLHWLQRGWQICLSHPCGR